MANIRILLQNKSLLDLGAVPVLSLTPRWLIFDPDNKRGLIIKAGTIIRTSNGNYITYSEDTKINLSSYISAAGTDYFVYLYDDGTIKCYSSYQTSGVKIGRFHTLCANVGTISMEILGNGKSSGSSILLKPYDQNDEPEFYKLYNKTVTSASTSGKYEVYRVPHPLNGFVAGDILPESVFCLSFKPQSLYEDAMIYDKLNNVAVDVYLQSGTGYNTRSKYNATHTVYREPINHQEDMRMVGKRLLEDDEFLSIAVGSNEKTSINGSSDKGTVGGHTDTAGRRMISIVGCEECCGYLWQ